MNTPLRLGIAGLGTVGTGVVKIEILPGMPHFDGDGKSGWQRLQVSRKLGKLSRRKLGRQLKERRTQAFGVLQQIQRGQKGIGFSLRIYKLSFM